MEKLVAVRHVDQLASLFKNMIQLLLLLRNNLLKRAIRPVQLYQLQQQLLLNLIRLLLTCQEVEQEVISMVITMANTINNRASMNHVMT